MTAEVRVGPAGGREALDRAKRSVEAALAERRSARLEEMRVHLEAVREQIRRRHGLARDLRAALRSRFPSV